MKVTPEHVNALIEHAQYHRFKNTTTTVCCITLKNGHTTVGYSACADPAEFNEQLGMKIAFNKARDEIYNLEAYMLSDALHRERKVTNAERAFNERSAIINDKPAPKGDFNPMVGAFIEMVNQNNGRVESTEEAEQDELEYPELNLNIEVDEVTEILVDPKIHEICEKLLDIDGDDVVLEFDSGSYRVLAMTEFGVIVTPYHEDTDSE